MSDGLILDVPRLNEQEMQQLQVLLFRYMVHKPSGSADVVTDKLVNKCQLTMAPTPPVAEVAEPVDAPEPGEAAEHEPSPVETPKRKAKTPEPAVASD
jgi:hypothetical protein